MKNQKRVLFKNTVMLYILTFSTYILSFIVVPYQTRVLGPDKFGLLGLASAIMVYAQLVMDFGFLLSATQEVSVNRDDRKRLSNIFTCVTVNKLFLGLISLGVVMLVCAFVDQWSEHLLFFALFFVSTLLTSLLPDYLYRGIEKMGAVTVRTVLIKVFFSLMVFVLVKDENDYLMIPILNIIGNGIALLCVYVHLGVKERIHFTKVGLFDLLNRFKLSATFFLSRIATTIYTVTNTIILDLMSGGAKTAYYTSADKLVSTAKSGVSPISDSLYPYLVRNKDFKLVAKVLLLIEPIIIIGCAIVFIWAEPLCLWFFGEEYGETAPILRALLPIVVIILPSYIAGFPMLGAMGLNKHANYSVILGSALHVVNLIVLYFTGNLTMITLGIAASIAELIILIYRCIVIYKNRILLKAKI